MKTKVLVTGAQGQLAQTLKELYVADDNIDFTFTSKFDLDITNSEEVSTFFIQNSFEFCINCAAYTNVEQAETTPEAAFLVNAEGVKNLANACKLNGVILIHISTDYVFDGKKQTPYTEDDHTHPINEYGKSKLKGEEYIRKILTRYFIIRTSWLYSKYGHNFLKFVMGKIQNQEQLKITTSQIGTPTSCNDLSEFLIQLIKQNVTNFGIYHFSAKGETNWYQFALQICKHFNNYDCNNIVPVKTFLSKAMRPNYSILDNYKAKLLFKKDVYWQMSVDKVITDLSKK